MPITKSAKKAVRSAKRKRAFNVRRIKVMRDTVKEVRQLGAAGKVAEAEKLLPKAFQSIDKAAKRGVIKNNTAARKKSRLARLLIKKA